MEGIYKIPAFPAARIRLVSLPELVTFKLAAGAMKYGAEKLYPKMLVLNGRTNQYRGIGKPAD